MALVKNLMDSAIADTNVLRTLDSQGDDFSIARDVDFFLVSSNEENAHTVAGFINEYQYGCATVKQNEAQWRVSVIINMPIYQHSILSVSGFMNCLGELFGLEYDGWGCVAQRKVSDNQFS